MLHNIENATVGGSVPEAVAVAPLKVDGEEDEDEGEEFEVPDEIASVVEKLLEGLCDSDTIVRWCAAKGIGRIAMRLPREEGDEVVQEILEMFEHHSESDHFWHGGCLALAELARRGLLLPSHLETVVPLVTRALLFDQRRGAHSVGAHVRDAACYVCWAFARAYSPEVMTPYVVQLAQTLIVISVYDREINCRRAASAAFQENVGRQGAFPSGIDILTAADYFTVGNRANAFLEVATFVAQFEGYREFLIEHLLQEKIQHWDLPLRELASRALSKLCLMDMDYCNDIVLPTLLQGATSKTLFVRHGSILGLASLAKDLKDAIDVPLELTKGLLSGVIKIIKNLKEKKLYRGHGGEMLRGAVSAIIVAMSELACSKDVLLSSLSDEGDAAFLVDGVIDNLNLGVEALQVPAAQALSGLLTCYESTLAPMVEEIVERLLAACSDSAAHKDIVRCGYIMAIGSLPKRILHKHRAVILGLAVSSVNPSKEKVPEMRRNSCLAIVNIVSTLSFEGEDRVTAEEYNDIFSCLLSTQNDYATDNRGAVGSWVREAGLNALKELSLLISSSETSKAHFTQEQCSMLFSVTIQQALEKLDKLRQVAGENLQCLVMASIPHMPHPEELRAAVMNGEVLDWSAPKVTFPLLVPLLNLEIFTKHVVLGLCDAAGAIGRAQSEYAAGSLLAHLASAPESQCGVMRSMVTLMSENASKERIVLAVLKTLNHIFANDGFTDVDDEAGWEDLFKQIKKQIVQSKKITKVQAAVIAMVGLLGVESASSVRSIALAFTVHKSLTHAYPRVRAVSAENLYNAILMDDSIVDDDDKSDEVQEILLESPWESELTELEEPLTRLSKLLDIDPSAE